MASGWLAIAIAVAYPLSLLLLGGVREYGLGKTKNRKPRTKQ